MLFHELRKKTHVNFFLFFNLLEGRLIHQRNRYAWHLFPVHSLLIRKVIQWSLQILFSVKHHLTRFQIKMHVFWHSGMKMKRNNFEFESLFNLIWLKPSQSILCPIEVKSRTLCRSSLNLNRHLVQETEKSFPFSACYKMHDQ